MVGIIAQSSSLNTFSSICYCCMALAIHIYSSYQAVVRYSEAESKAWPGGGGTPSEVPLVLGTAILSVLILPFFCLTCFIKVGNYANDGVKLGRDHALGYQVGETQDSRTAAELLNRAWRHFCPLSQTVHLVAAFLLLLPETLLTAVEVKFGYKSADVSWSSNLDFLYLPGRPVLSEIRSSVNLSQPHQPVNASHHLLPTPRAPMESWGERVTVSVSFVNFCLALCCLLVRYSSVFWYTNKSLTAIFCLQLLAMVLNSVFSFNSFSVLYCVCYNRRLYPNVSLSLGCALGLVLYLVGSSILLLSSMTVFEYGCHYFHEKFLIVERHHLSDSYVKQTVLAPNGWQGYLPHSCAMACLMLLAVCKGPLLYDLVSLMRLTGDQLLLTGVVCEVCYMILWLVLWFCLTLKQQWQFRILDYVSLRQPVFATPDSIVKYNQTDSTDNPDAVKGKRLSGRDFNPKNAQSATSAAIIKNEDNVLPDLGSDDSDFINNADMVGIPDGNCPIDPNSSLRRSRSRRNGPQRVTFNETAGSSSVPDPQAQRTPISSLTRQGNLRPDEAGHVNVRADVHNIASSAADFGPESPPDGVTLRKKPCMADNREYRNSLRSKCGEFYTASPYTLSGDEPATGLPEPLPTLMSSFRDKVRESSLAASTFRERERHMLEHFDYLDPLPPPIVEDLHVNHGDRGLSPSDEDMSDTGYHIHNQADSDYHIHNQVDSDYHIHHQTDSDYHIPQVDRHGPYLSDAMSDGNSFHRQRDDLQMPQNNIEVGRSGLSGGSNDMFVYDNSTGSCSLPARKQYPASLGEVGHRNSIGNSTLESSELSMPPAMEDLQLEVYGRPGAGPLPTPRRTECPVPGWYPSQPSSLVGGHFRSPFQVRPVQVVVGQKHEIGRRDSANFSLTSSQDTSSSESDSSQGVYQHATLLGFN